MEAFERQSDEYMEAVLPRSCVYVIAIEAGSAMPWYKYANIVIGVGDFGFSGQVEDLMESFGITLKNLKESIALATRDRSIIP
jgi:transketolase